MLTTALRAARGRTGYVADESWRPVMLVLDCSDFLRLNNEVTQLANEHVSTPFRKISYIMCVLLR
jgi:hypothetical protein